MVPTLRLAGSSPCIPSEDNDADANSGEREQNAPFHEAISIGRITAQTQRVFQGLLDDNEDVVDALLIWGGPAKPYPCLQ
jgi:hypothetical protein